MIEVIFDLNGETKKEMAIFDTVKEMQEFMKTFVEEVLENYPSATNIKLGQCYVSI